MGLIGSSNEEKIWNYLYSKLGNAYGTAGIMGNIFAESALNPKNLQNTYEKKLGYTDESYTAAVDNGSYTNFIYDKAGYGLFQCTFWSIKRDLYNFAKSRGTSIGDLEMQLDFLYDQMKRDFPKVWNICKSASSIEQASNAMLLQFERPADQSYAVQKKRTAYGQTYYEKYAKTAIKGGNNMGYTNSPLTNCTIKSPNHSGARTHKIDRITPHCVVGQLTAEGIGSCFTNPGVQASCNYGIGKDGRVCLIVDEANRSWCSSSNANDQRAITIECASDTYDPYAFKQITYNKLVELCIDICKRNGLTKVIWFGDANKSLSYQPKNGECVLTVHRWFANKACPGDWLYNRMGQLANEINAGLGNASSTPTQTPTTPSVPNKIPNPPFTAKVLIDDLNIRKTPSSTDDSNLIGKYTGKGNFTIVEVKDGWGLLKSYQKNRDGWIYLENAAYCSIIGGSQANSSFSPTASAASYKVRVTVDELNIRNSPGTTGTKIVGAIKDKGVYTIVQEADGSGASKWGKLKSGQGWVSLDYCRKV